MSIKGRINQITDPLGFFGAVLAGQGVPATGSRRSAGKRSP